MSWAEVSTMSLRLEFVTLSLQPGANLAQLCRRFGISRKTGYKWRVRYQRGAAAALQDRTRRPRSTPTRTPAQVEAQVLRLRQQRHWGGRKIHHRLRALGHSEVPAPSTINSILKRNHLIDAQESLKHRATQRFEQTRPNALWQMDFKGHFATHQQRCHPLTVLDDCSRFCISLRACADERSSTVQACLSDAFTRYGLPERMLMDNGAPWGADAQHPFTCFTVWLIRLGIRVSHIRPYHPQTQGKDERFHRSLNQELLKHACFEDLAHCQRHFDPWRDAYNFERPHESLNMQVPAQRYCSSVRSFVATLPPIQYATEDAVRIVQRGGRISFQGRTLRICKALFGQPIALRPTPVDGQWRVYFCQQYIKTVNLHCVEG